MTPVYRDRKLTQLVNNDHLQKDLFEEFGWLKQSRGYIVALVQVNGKTIETFQGDRDLTYFTILNIINEILKETGCGIGFRYLTKKGKIVLIFWDKFELVEEILVHIYKTLKNMLDVSCPIAAGKAVNNSCKLIDSYQHARKVLLNRNILTDCKSRVYLSDIEAPPSLKSLIVYSSDIEMAIQTGEIGAFKELMDRIEKDIIEKEYLSVRQVINLENEYMVISNKWFKHYNISFKAPEDIEERIDFFLDSNGTFSLEKYKERKTREITIFLKKVKKRALQRSNNIITDIEKYLQENFDRDVKLQEISDHFYISREYISRKFKQEF
jgi:two-component system response regulator YesN